MDLNKLPKTTKRPKKRVGRGIGSGKGGHTSGRGTKGQKAREDIPLLFEGTKFKKSLVKRIPFLRGRNKQKSWGRKVAVINLDKLADWPEKTPVTTENLIKKGLMEEGEVAKILGNGKISKALTVKVAVSVSAGKLIEKAGGKVETKE